MDEKRDVIVEMVNISKSFPGVKALEGVNFTIRRGEVHGLVGENGAGKSTLIKILTGAIGDCDEGEILIDGRKADIKSPIHARRHGLAAVYQDVNLATNLTVAENFFLGKIPLNRGGFVDWKRMFRVTRSVLQELDLDIDPRTPVRKLLSAEQAMVVIAKIVHEESKVIIFDEPTALITKEETEQIFKLIGKLKEKGVGIIYISHRLEEVFRICDVVTVLKDGKEVGTLPVSEVDDEAIISMMVGKSVANIHYVGQRTVGRKILEVRNLTKEKAFTGISLHLSEGEALGFYGLVGSGMASVAKSIFGGEAVDSGEIFLHGERVSINSPVDGIRHRIGFLPEDRKNGGLAIPLDIVTNINLASYRTISRTGFINMKKERDNARHYVDVLDIKTPSIRQKAKNLSGGNQQKVVFAKWLCSNSRIFIFDEPTVGVDVGARFEIYTIIEDILRKGNAVILVSSYLPEIIGLTDRAMIFYEGKCMGCVAKPDYNEELFLNLASGIRAGN